MEYYVDSRLRLERETSVRLHQDGRSVVLSPGLNEDEFREGVVWFEVRSGQKIRIFFDDRLLDLIWTENDRSGYGHIDLINQIGYHRFSVRAESGEINFDFRVVTAKATHAEVESMARVVAGQVYSFKRQFVYTDAAGVRKAVPLPEIALGWLRDRLGEILRLVDSINARPALETRQQFETAHCARGVSVPHTLRLIRELPGLLEARDDGPLEVDGIHYWPAAVVVRRRNREPARVEHLQLAYFLSSIARMLPKIRPFVPRELIASINEWELGVARARATSIVKRYDTVNAFASWTPLPTQLQKFDRRYRRVRELQAEFLQDIDVAVYSEDVVRANVRDAWEIYQAFSAHMIGRAFGLQYVSRKGDLRERSGEGFSMYSNEYELFYDCRLPAHVASSWRDITLRPAKERPDIVLRQRSNGAVAVLDAKFKVDSDGRSAKGEDLFEMQGYLNSFFLDAGGIVFPGDLSQPRFLKGRGITLAEIPLRASFFEKDLASVLFQLRSAVEQLLCVPKVEHEKHLS